MIYVFYTRCIFITLFKKSGFKVSSERSRGVTQEVTMCFSDVSLLWRMHLSGNNHLM